MKITFELDYDEAYELLRKIRIDPSSLQRFSELEVLPDALAEAIANEEERAYQRRHERLMESGGVDDSQYRRDMKDAGRGHLIQ